VARSTLVDVADDRHQRGQSQPAVYDRGDADENLQHRAQQPFADDLVGLLQEEGGSDAQWGGNQDRDADDQDRPQDHAPGGEVWWIRVRRPIRTEEEVEGGYLGEDREGLAADEDVDRDEQQDKEGGGRRQE
jgi:hypothetical protein